MMNKVAKMLIGTMIIINLFGSNRESSDIGNNVLKSGKIIDIEYSQNPESTNYKESLDKMYFEIEGHIYLHYDLADDMFIGDDVLVCIDTKGTKSQKDDVIMMWRYWCPDFAERY